MRRTTLGFLAITLLVGPGSAAPVPKGTKPSVGETNTNALVLKHTDQLKLEASSEYDGYSVKALVDGDPTTPWYSKSGDAPQAGQKTAVTVTFPENVSIKRVTVLGNRDPQYPTGYSVLEGTVELLDKDRKTISKHELKAAGDKRDFDLILTKFATVRSVRFTATKDEGTSNCIGLGEFQVE